MYMCKLNAFLAAIAMILIPCLKPADTWYEQTDAAVLLFSISNPPQWQYGWELLARVTASSSEVSPLIDSNSCPVCSNLYSLGIVTNLKAIQCAASMLNGFLHCSEVNTVHGDCQQYIMDCAVWALGELTGRWGLCLSFFISYGTVEKCLIFETGP